FELPPLSLPPHPESCRMAPAAAPRPANAPAATSLAAQNRRAARFLSSAGGIPRACSATEKHWRPFPSGSSDISSPHALPTSDRPTASGDSPLAAAALRRLAPPDRPPCEN